MVAILIKSASDYFSIPCSYLKASIESWPQIMIRILIDCSLFFIVADNGEL